MSILQEVESDFNYTLADGGSVPYRLTALDTSDCCGFRSYFRVTLKSKQQLLFCNHHFNVHREALTSVASHVVDESSALRDNRLKDSEN